MSQQHDGLWRLSYTDHRYHLHTHEALTSRATISAMCGHSGVTVRVGRVSLDVPEHGFCGNCLIVHDELGRAARTS